MRQRGFALLDVLLAVALMAIAAAASYTLVKSFRVNSATQQFIRYATNIQQSIMPFLDGGAASSSGVYSNNQLSQDFLNSIGIPAADQICTNKYCYVNSGMSVSGDASTLMSFDVSIDNTYATSNYFLMAVTATGSQVNQILQSTSSLFSVFCPSGAASALSTATISCALLPKTEASKPYSLFLVFPKSGNTYPANASSFAPQAAPAS